MRLLLFMLLILGLGFNSCSSKHEARTPKEIGPQSMELLNKMGEITKPEFSEFFISYQEMRDIADNESLNVDEKQKKGAMSPYAKIISPVKWGVDIPHTPNEILWRSNVNAQGFKLL